MGLDLDKFRRINVARSERFCTKLDDWSNADWGIALAEEAGEVCGVFKKMKRMESGINFSKDPQTEEEYLEKLAEELADVISYADLIAAKNGINLSKAVQKKWNEVSDRFEGCSLKIKDEDLE